MAGIIVVHKTIFTVYDPENKTTVSQCRTTIFEKENSSLFHVFKKIPQIGTLRTSIVAAYRFIICNEIGRSSLTDDKIWITNRPSKYEINPVLLGDYEGDAVILLIPPSNISMECLDEITDPEYRPSVCYTNETMLQFLEGVSSVSADLYKNFLQSKLKELGYLKD